MAMAAERMTSGNIPHPEPFRCITKEGEINKSRIAERGKDDRRIQGGGLGYKRQLLNSALRTS
jgi:hypothetical protein